MFGLAILGIAAFLAVLGLFTATIVPTIPDVLTDVPTLYDYDEFGKRITDTGDVISDTGEIDAQISDIQSQIKNIESQMEQAILDEDWNQYEGLKTEKTALEEELSQLDFSIFNHPNQRLELYWFFAYPSLAILIIFIMIAGATHYWEKSFGLFKKGTSLEIVKTSIIGFAVILLVPEFWDTFAIYMKQFSMYLLDPFGKNPEVTVTRLRCKMGCIVNLESALSMDSWSIALSNPSNFGQAILTSALLPLFKTIPVAMLSLSLFVIAKIRVLFIMIVLLTLPLWMVSMNIPFIKKHANDMISNIIGASIAPIFSALTLFVGLSYLDAKPIPALEEWISVLGIGIFASLWPVILAPKLSIIASQTTGMVQTAIQSTATLTSGVTSGLGSGMAQSGALPGMKGSEGMSKMSRLKTLLSTGATGAAMGGAGQISPVNIPGPNQQSIRNSLNKGLGESAVKGQVSEINSMNPNNIDPQISNGMMHNPGNYVDSMQKGDLGRSHMETSSYEQQLHSEVGHLSGPQKESGMAAIRQADINNPGASNR